MRTVAHFVISLQIKQCANGLILYSSSTEYVNGGHPFFFGLAWA